MSSPVRVPTSSLTRALLQTQGAPCRYIRADCSSGCAVNRVDPQDQWYEARNADQVFMKAVAHSSFEEGLAITVLNPRVLFFKEKACQKLTDRYSRLYMSCQAAKFRLKDLHAELNRIQVEAGANNSRIFDIQHNIKTTLLICAAARPPPLHLPRNITPDDLRLHYAFLIDPLFPEANPPVLKPAASIAEGIVQLRTSLGLPPAGGQTAVANLLTNLRAELAILIRKLVTLDLDKDVVLQDVAMEETTIHTLNDMLPRLTGLMRSKSVYGAEGLDQEGQPGGQAPPPGGVAGGAGNVGGVAGGGLGGAPAPNVASTCCSKKKNVAST